ncbi:hypothetical protein [Ornithinibacillus gellani]|uniref:hypothetical protein n=1 Tax=Ornithinibacillus gellani TaxID=2293253 RepID=UPI00168053D6|nr:hypothetical protein [Ornithinibacillus gellani]
MMFVKSESAFPILRLDNRKKVVGVNDLHSFFKVKNAFGYEKYIKLLGNGVIG